MANPEFNHSAAAEIVPEALTNGLIYLSSRHHLGYDEDRLAGLFEQASAGQEVVVQLVAESIWTPRYTPENEALRESLNGGWAYSFEEWLWKNGQRYTGTPTENLRNPVSGRIADPGFIASLTQTGTAVELTRRQDETRGTVVVNNIWNLWKIAGTMELWPVATVDTVDADVGENSYWRNYTSLYVPHPIAVGRKLVLLPDLALPWA
jgi:hypothetical protein